MFSRSTKLVVILSVVFVSALAASSYAEDPPSWDLFDLDFGSGAGKTSLGAATSNAFNTTYDMFDIDPGVYGAQVENLAADSTSIAPAAGNSAFWLLAQGQGNSFSPGVHPNPGSCPPCAAGEGPYTVEFRLKGSRSTWDFAVAGNGGSALYFTTSGNTGLQFAPVGATGAAATDVDVNNLAGWNGYENYNTYRVIAEKVAGGATELSLQINGYDTNKMNIPGSTGSGLFGINLYVVNGEQVDFAYLRGANGAYYAEVIPEPATALMLSLGGLLTMMFRRRRR